MVFGLVLLVLSMLDQGVEIAMIVPTLGLFSAAAFRLMPSVNRLLFAVQSLRYEVVVLDRLRAELALPAPEPIAHTDADTARFRDSISVNGVEYTYPSAASPALSDISLRIGFGECMAKYGARGECAKCVREPDPWRVSSSA